MNKKYLHLLFFLFFSAVNNNTVAAQEQEYAEAIKILQDNENLFGTLGERIFLPLKKLLTSELDNIDIADYREYFYQVYNSLPQKKKVAIMITDNFDHTVRRDIEQIKLCFTEKEQKENYDLLANVDNIEGMLNYLAHLRNRVEKKQVEMLSQDTS